MTLSDLLNRLEGVRQAGDHFQAICPAHPDRKPSMSISEGDTQPIVLHCFAGCTTEAILEALQLPAGALSAPREDDDRPKDVWTPQGPSVASYEYTDEEGRWLYTIHRTAAKEFPAVRPDPSAKGGQRWNLKGVRRVLYRLPRITKALQEATPIWVVEGEKDVQSLERRGHVATCNSGGSQAWTLDHAKSLEGAAEVIVVRDRDEAGEKWAANVQGTLMGKVGRLIVAEAREGKDVTDHLNAGLTEDELTVIHDSELGGLLGDPLIYWDDLLGMDIPPPDWVIPQVMERGDRLILTGAEGLGKSTLTRQLCLAAAGVHPFSLFPMEPIRVLYVDLENSARHMQRQFQKLKAGLVNQKQQGPGRNLAFINRPEGMNLLGDADASYLMARVLHHKPDLVIIGPIYKLHEGNPHDEEPARKLAAYFDRLRTEANCALVLEAHAPHGAGDNGRELRPFGASLWRRWPEFGYGLRIHPDEKAPNARRVKVEAWRGPRDTEREWPRFLLASRPYFWIDVTDQVEAMDEDQPPPPWKQKRGA